MAIQLAENISEMLNYLVMQYHRLLLVVGEHSAGKTAAFHEIASRTGTPLININLQLSRVMLDLTERQRSLQVPQLLNELIGQTNQGLVLLDNTEILFDRALKQDPLRLLQRLSRNSSIVATWNGRVEQDFLIYAEPWHHEYRKYPIRDLLCVCAG